MNGSVFDFLEDEFNSPKCCTCKYNGLSTEEEPCSQCRWTYDDKYEKVEK